MLSFISAVYNEQEEIDDLINHITPYVDGIYIADDGSTDDTRAILELTQGMWVGDKKFKYKTIDHTGLPETVKNEALQMVPNDSWVLMLDADERFANGVLDQIKEWLQNPEDITHVYFNQIEIIDNVPVRTFQKSKLFKKEAIQFPLDNIHADDQFEGKGIFKESWVVYHRKTSTKQKNREIEYLETYDRLYQEGKIDEGRLRWLRGLHHYVT